MSMFRYSPAFRLVPQNPTLVSVPSVVSKNKYGPGPTDDLVGNWSVLGVHTFRFYPSRTAGWQWFQPGVFVDSSTTIVGASNLVVDFELASQQTVRAYQVFRSGPDTGGGFWYHGWLDADGNTNPVYRVAGGGGVPGVALPTTSFSWNSRIDVALGNYLASGPVSGATFVQRGDFVPHVFVESLVYQDLSPDPERADQNLVIRRRERGVRPDVRMRAVVLGGSPFEDQLINVYNAKLLGQSQFRVLFTMNYDVESPRWRAVSIVGDFMRTPFGGRNTFSEFTWDLVYEEPQNQVPGMVVADGRGNV